MEGALCCVRAPVRDAIAQTLLKGRAPHRMLHSAKPSVIMSPPASIIIRSRSQRDSTLTACRRDGDAHTNSKT